MCSPSDSSQTTGTKKDTAQNDTARDGEEDHLIFTRLSFFSVAWLAAPILVRSLTGMPTSAGQFRIRVKTSVQCIVYGISTESDASWRDGISC